MQNRNRKEQILEKHWWQNYPWRMIQTNLREIDMEQINAREYAKELKDFGATVVTLNSAGILASYKSEHPYHSVSGFLHGDSLAQLIDACHEEGIRVIARTDFSKVHYDLYEKHPEWAYRTSKGEIMNYNGDVQVCPNGDYQQTVMFEILEEVLTRFPFDGVFCNMSGFLVVDYSGKYYGPCHCDNCVSRFREQFGLEIPLTDDFHNPDYLKYMAFKKGVTEKHKAKMRTLVKSIREDLCMNNLDYIRSESNTEIGRPQWVYSASSNSRLGAGRARLRPSDNASVDFMGFRYRDTSVSPALMELRQWQNLANSGCVSMYIMGTLGSHRDRSGFAPTKKVFAFHAAHQELYTGLRSAAKVLLLRRGMWQRTDPETAGWIRALTESHIPFDERNLDELQSGDQLQGITTIILGDLKGLRPAQTDIFADFTRQGGTLIATGETRLPEQGIEEVTETRHNAMSAVFALDEQDRQFLKRCADTAYIAPGQDLLVVKPAETTHTWLHLIDEHPFGPPERCYYTQQHVTAAPGVLMNSCGSGQIITIPFRIGAMYHNEGYQNSLNLMQDVLFELAHISSLAPDASPMFEVTLSEKEGLQVIQLVNTSGCFANSYFPPLPISGIRLETDFKYREVHTLNGGTVGIQEDCLILDQLREYEAIVLRQ